LLIKREARSSHAGGAALRCGPAPFAVDTAPDRGLRFNLIATTTTKAGLKVACELDQSMYPSGIKVSKNEMEEINLRRDAFHGEWNYTISPRSQKWVSIP
jgi:hypothetical protein